MNRKQLALQLGISASMVTRHAKRGMPTDDLAKAERWRKRHLQVMRTKGVRADTGSTPGASGHVSNPAEDRASVAGQASAPDDLVAMAAAETGGEAWPSADPGEPPAADAGYQLSRARQAAADARVAEIKLAELEGLLIRVDAIKVAMAQLLAPVREGLLQIPARMAPILAQESQPGRIQTLIEAEIYQVLAPLADRAMVGTSADVAAWEERVAAYQARDCDPASIPAARNARNTGTGER